MEILHLSHTDINLDSRILKEINSIASANSIYNVTGIGVASNKKIVNMGKKNNFTIDHIVLQSRKLIFLPTTIRHMFTTVELIFKMIYRAIKLKPNIIHCHDTFVLPSGIIVKLCTGAKLIYDAHELESDRNNLTKIKGKLTLYTEKLFWNLIDALIVVSPSIGKWYKDNIGDKCSEIILNSPILAKDTFLNNKQYLRNHFSISKDSRIFLYIGILGQGRGIDLITEVFKNYDLKSSLVFLGYGKLSDELKDLAKSYTNIYVHDSVPHEQVVSIAKSADVGLCLIQNVSLSDYYCLPNKLFEYSFSEIPILASDFPDISKVVTRYNLGKCTELSLKSIFNAIKEFEDMKELPKIDANNLYNLSWDAQEEKLVKLYNKIIEEK